MIWLIWLSYKKHLYKKYKKELHEKYCASPEKFRKNIYVGVIEKVWDYEDSSWHLSFHKRGWF